MLMIQNTFKTYSFTWEIHVYFYNARAVVWYAQNKWNMKALTKNPASRMLQTAAV